MKAEGGRPAVDPIAVAGAPVGAVNPSAQASPVTPAAPAPAPVVPGSPAAPASQLVSVLSPLRAGAEGSHQISLRLMPETLGSVDATVTVKGAQVVVELTAHDPVARAALAEALPQLRHELGTPGNPATVVLSDRGSGGSTPQDSFRSSGPESLGSAEDDTEGQPTAPLTPSSGRHVVDIRL